MYDRTFKQTEKATFYLRGGFFFFFLTPRGEKKKYPRLFLSSSLCVVRGYMSRQPRDRIFGLFFVKSLITNDLKFFQRR